MSSVPTRYAVLLRAINLGKARRVAMPRLREVLTDAGHGRVVTHLNSGNVLLDSPLPEAELMRFLAEERGRFGRFAARFPERVAG